MHCKYTSVIVISGLQEFLVRGVVKKTTDLPTIGTLIICHSVTN
jgi:hypothetical protein